MSFLTNLKVLEKMSLSGEGFETTTSGFLANFSTTELPDSAVPGKFAVAGAHEPEDGDKGGRHVDQQQPQGHHQHYKYRFQSDLPFSKHVR